MAMPLALMPMPQARLLRIPRGVWSRSWAISGQTVDAAGVALGGCTVKLFLTAGDIEIQSAVSDPLGNYGFQVSDQRAYYCVAYLAGSPDRAGTTVNTLVGV